MAVKHLSKNIFSFILSKEQNVYCKVGRLYSSSAVTSGDFVESKESNVNCNSALPYDQVPGPKPMPILGNTWRFIPYIGNVEIEHIDKLCLKLYAKFGPIVKMSHLLGRPDMLFVFDPDDIEQVFRSEDTLPHRPSMPSLNYYKHVLRGDVFGKNGGVIAVHGEDWLNFRVKVQQAMLQPRTAKLYIGSIEDAAKDFISRIRTIRDKNLEMPDDFLNEVNKWSLESIASIALDTRLGCLDPNPPSDTQQLIDAVTTFFKNVPVLELKVPFWKIFSTPTWKKYIYSLDTIKNISTHHIEKAMKKGITPGRERSLLQRLLAANTNDPKIAVMMAVDMFLVGIDTTATAVASILYQLSQNQDVQEKLYKEISTILPSISTPITSTRLEEMQYLKAIIKETLRKHPVVIGNGRCLTKDTIIRGYQIPKGTQVIFQHYVISNMDKYFPNSQAFSPERWLKRQNEEMDVSRTRECPHYHAFASLPFGYGKRMCLGKRFADLEIQTVVCKLVQAYKIEYHHPPLDYHINPMYTPDGPLRLRFIDRETL